MITKHQFFIFILLVVTAFILSFIPYFAPIALLFILLQEYTFRQSENTDTYIELETKYKGITKKDAFMGMKYDYLHSTNWDEKRKKRLRKDSYFCQSCEANNVPLEVHHVSGYDELPFEPASSLISLCRNCHEHQHTIYGFPQTYEEYQNWNAPLVKSPKS